MGVKNSMEHTLFDCLLAKTVYVRYLNKSEAF
jgi:hypothetical protein